MEEEKAVEKLKAFGLTEYEAKVYLTLVKFGALNAKEISLKAKIPKNRVYDSTNTLEEKGFVEKTPGTPNKYDAINPELSFKRSFESLRKLEEELERAYEKSKTEEKPIQVGYGRKFAVEARLKAFRNTQKICSGIVGLEEITTERLGMIDREVKNIISRGGEVKFLSNMDYEGNRDKAEKLSKYGVKYKHFPSKKFTCLIRDREVFMLELPHPEKGRANIWIRNEDFAKKMQMFFEREWEERS